MYFRTFDRKKRKEQTSVKAYKRQRQFALDEAGHRTCQNHCTNFCTMSQILKCTNKIDVVLSQKCKKIKETTTCSQGFVDLHSDHIRNDRPDHIGSSSSFKYKIFHYLLYHLTVHGNILTV